MSRYDAIQIFLAGLEAVKPAHFIPQNLQFNKNIIKINDQTFSLTSIENLYIVAVGKAAAAMAFETEKILGSAITQGIVVTKYGHGLQLSHCSTIEAGHPMPDKNSLLGGKAIMKLFKKATQKDLIILLISGGASSLVADSPSGCTLEDIQITIQLLLDCGAAIDEINTVRKHLSNIKGGRLMQTTHSTVAALILSDVPDNDLSVIASGLTVPDKSTFNDAWRVIEHYQLVKKLPSSARDHLINGVNKMTPDTPKPGAPAFDNVYNHLVATNKVAIEAAAAKAQLLGYTIQIISPVLSGEADKQAENFINYLKNEMSKQPVCVLWGGETTVTIKGTGKGGRNQQFVLAALCALKDQGWLAQNNAAILSAGTDGTDGPTTATGAVIDPDTVIKVKAMAIHPEQFLQDNDAFHFFEKVDGLIVTGPTQTNVMDIVVGLMNKK
ncbi:MAG TPA: DUF4147 domain-containing protein [Agriterribacter sp.]|nr:DUF4147 domain-containing protein [Agriterribacter sp.]